MSIEMLHRLARDGEGWSSNTIEGVCEDALVEIDKLKADLQEAREVITGLMPAALSGILLENNNGLAAFNDPRLVRARSFLDRTGK